jgi:hypothetical protein
VNIEVELALQVVGAELSEARYRISHWHWSSARSDAKRVAVHTALHPR